MILTKYCIKYVRFLTRGYRDVWSELLALVPWAGLVRGWGLFTDWRFSIWVRLAGSPRPGGDETLLCRLMTLDMDSMSVVSGPT